MTPDFAEVDQELVERVLRGVGYCLAQYQQIEWHLKFILPHLQRADSKSREFSTDFNWIVLRDSKATLGSLMKDFRQRTETDKQDGFTSFLDRLVIERNYLVHGLLADPERPLRSNEDAERMIELLRQYLCTATAMAQALREVLAQLATSSIRARQ